MVIRLFALLSFLLPTVLLGCGGKDDDDKDCKDFTYQEDAQGWHNAHPEDGLDSDNDGIACEALPNRPTSPGGGGGGGGGSAVTPVSLQAVLLNGAHASLTSQVTNYTVRLRTVGTPFNSFERGTNGATLLLDSQGRTILSDTDFQWYDSRSENFLLIGGPGVTGGGTYLSGGLGSRQISSIADSAGVYKVLGQRCTGSTSAATCSVLFGSLSVSSTGRISFCPSQEYSDNCPSGETDTIVSSSVVNRLEGSRGGHFLPVATSGLLAYSFGGGASSSLFGIRADRIITEPGQATMHVVVIHPNDIGRTDTPAFAGQTVSLNSPISGFMSSQTGLIYIRSTALVVYWNGAKLALAMPY